MDERRKKQSVEFPLDALGDARHRFRLFGNRHRGPVAAREQFLEHGVDVAADRQLRGRIHVIDPSRGVIQVFAHADASGG